ncbi:MAG TPA: MFS transporter [Opitutaceae bacterium]|jgi:hypothetical protein
MPPESGPRPPHPAVFALLYSPFGVSTGVVGVTLACLATQTGLTVEQGAVLVASGYLPQMVKFLWAPVTDLTRTRRWWYMWSGLASGVLLFGCLAVPLGPRTFILLNGLIILMSLASTFQGFACEGFLAHLVPEDQRGKYSGWFQAGNTAGNAFGGGAGLWLMLHWGRLPTAACLFGLMVVWIPLLFCFPDVPAGAAGATVRRALKQVGRDIGETLRSRVGVLSLLLCFMPVGTGAASSVLAQAAVAAHWRAGSADVEWTQGWWGGLACLVGSLAGGYGCKLFGSRGSYAIYGGIMAACTAAITLCPNTPQVYLWGVIAYSVITGMTYAAFSAVVLDAIGKGNAATKYNVFAGVSNVPIWYMGLVLAWAETTWGPKGMLLTESALGVLGILVFLAVVALRFGRSRPPALETAAAP